MRPSLFAFVVPALPALIMACALVCANMIPQNDGAPGVSAFRVYGFPFPYRFDNVVNWQNVFGDGGTIENPREEIIWHTTFDGLGLLANFSVGAFLVLAAWTAWHVLCHVFAPQFWRKIAMGDET